MALGPVEYVILGFPGNKFNGHIVPELDKLVSSETIRVLDLVFISKDADGDVTSVEFEDHDDVALFNQLEGEVVSYWENGRVLRRSFWHVGKEYAEAIDYDEDGNQL